MNTPEVTALSAEELDLLKQSATPSSWRRMCERLLATIAERDERVRKAEDKAEKFMWQVRDTCARAEKAESELAALKSRAVSGDDRKALKTAIKTACCNGNNCSASDECAYDSGTCRV